MADLEEDPNNLGEDGSERCCVRWQTAPRSDIEQPFAPNSTGPPLLITTA
jgi:hypothetical protein